MRLTALDVKVIIRLLLSLDLWLGSWLGSWLGLWLLLSSSRLALGAWLGLALDLLLLNNLVVRTLGSIRHYEITFLLKLLDLLVMPYIYKCSETYLTMSS